MKLSHTSYAIFLALLIACSTATPPPRHSIDLADMEKLRPGQATSQKLKSSLGDPGQTIFRSATEEIWVYSFPHGDSNWQRASFTLDKQTGMLLASVLLLEESDSIYHLDQAILYFSSSHFSIQNEGSTDSHEYSDYTNYIDEVHGISMTVKKARRTVSEIGFWQPSKTQAPLAAQQGSS